MRVTKLSKAVNRNAAPYDVYIGRGSKWGNPFSHKQGTKASEVVASRDEAVDRYWDYLLTQDHLLQSLRELQGKRLGCYCKPSKCHGDILASIVNSLDEKELESMSLAKLKQKIAEQKAGRKPGENPVQNEGVGTTSKRTPTNVKRPPSEAPKEATLPKQTPGGYTVLGKNDVDALMVLKDEIIKAGVCSYDYETNGDPDDETSDPQDHVMVGVSVSYRIGMAVYLPVKHDSYAANWDVNWLVEHFLKPILEHPDVLVIAHNIKFESQINLLHGIDMFAKCESRKVMDTMLLVKALALDENIENTGKSHEVIVGLKPATKALLADKDGMVHGLLHVDEIKSFVETVGKHTWETPTGEYYKTGKNKGLPKTQKHSRSRTFNELPVDKHTIDYGCSDSDWALGLYEKLMPLAVSEEIDDVLFELDVPFMMTLGEYEMAGWRINREKLEHMRVVAEEALSHLNPKLDDALRGITSELTDTDEDGNVLVPAGIYGMGEWRGEPIALEIKSTKPFNWGSTQHKQWLFFHVLKVDTRGLERSKSTGLPSTGKENFDSILNGFTGDNAFMRVLKEKQTYDKLISTYVGEEGKANGMLPFCREDTEKIHTNLKLVSTWRLSSKKPNLQNIPRADNDPMGIRGVFEAPSYDPMGDYTHLNICTRPVPLINTGKLSGHTFYIASDYSQIELKVLAWYAMESAMIETLANGGDLHSKVAQQVFKLDCTVEEVKTRYKPFRYRAKKVNFGIVYGMTEFGLSKDPEMGMTKDEAYQFIQNYYATYPGIRDYAREMIEFARKNGYVQTMFGHRRPIPEINHPNKWVRSSGENKAMNTPIQGSASDIIRQSMVNLRKRIPTEAPFLKGVMQIHDELIMECPVEYAVEGARFVKEVMEMPIDGFSDIMPIIAEPAVGKIWQHALDISWDSTGTPYVKPKREKKEATDVTFAEIEYAMELYKLAGIDVRG